MSELPLINTKKRFNLNNIFTKKNIFKLFFGVIMISFVSWSSLSYFQSKEEIEKLSSLEGQQEIQKEEVADLLTKIRVHMILPDDEEPTVAIVSDIETLLEQQPFFNKAQNGDKVLVYAKARKAIIYSPEKDVIVNVGALMINNTNAPVIDSESSMEIEEEDELSQLNIEIRNGTDIDGLSRQVSSRLEAGNPAFKLTAPTNAANKDYQETIIVDFGKTENQDLIVSLRDVLGSSITSQQLPDGESESQAEVLVILGKDQN